MRQLHPALLEQGEEPLKQQMLSEKHLATYYGTIEIRGQTFRVLFDTGSCEFWIPAEGCTTPRCLHHRRYNSHQELFRYAQTPVLNIQYLSGRVQGKMVYEDVRVENVVVPQQVIGLADVVDIELLDVCSFAAAVLFGANHRFLLLCRSCRMLCGMVFSVWRIRIDVCNNLASHHYLIMSFGSVS